MWVEIFILFVGFRGKEWFLGSFWSSFELEFYGRFLEMEILEVVLF